MVGLKSRGVSSGVVAAVDLSLMKKHTWDREKQLVSSELYSVPYVVRISRKMHRGDIGPYHS